MLSLKANPHQVIVLETSDGPVRLHYYKAAGDRVDQWHVAIDAPLAVKIHREVKREE